jgi:hypothetical protein
VALGLAVLPVAAGCTGPVRSDQVYASKAASSAKATTSAVQTVQLAVQQAVRGKLFGRTLAQTLAEAASDDDNGHHNSGLLIPTPATSAWTARRCGPWPPRRCGGG